MRASEQGTMVGGWTRRNWLGGAAATMVPLRALLALDQRYPAPLSDAWRPLVLAKGFGQAADPLDSGPVQALAQRAVEAAQAAGATYTDARLTRWVEHHYLGFRLEFEFVGCGVRVLADGCWGFASAPVRLSQPQREELVVQLAREAVAQAKTTAQTVRRRPSVELCPAPAVTGTWQTPCGIDPFRVSLEEKEEYIEYLNAVAGTYGLILEVQSQLVCARQERVLATSGGSLVTQTCFETGGILHLQKGSAVLGALFTGASLANVPSFTIPILFSGQGWEYILALDLPEKIRAAAQQPDPSHGTPVTIGRYPLVCDGATMAAVLGETLGLATQVDRSLGYEANVGGTSFLNDPLTMLGTFQVASPVVTVTANRSAPTQLATVKWDDEGVVSPPFTLVDKGVLHDFQTTRAQAPLLAPYYQRLGRAVTSNGCAAAQDALRLPMQMRPNLALAPSPHATSLDALIKSVRGEALLIEGGTMSQVDSQVRNGVLKGEMHKIVNGKVGNPVTGGVVKVNVPQWWKAVQAVGDATTTGFYASTQYNDPWHVKHRPGDKGNPGQTTSYTAQGVAAVIDQQAIIDPRRKI